MKRILLLLVIIPIFFGCEKEQPFEKNGIYVNGQLECELKSAFSGGGSSANGSSNRLHIYEKYYSASPLWNEVKERVLIQGFCYAGKEYDSKGDSISQISINGLSSIGDLLILLDQGKYEGGNDLVSSVKIVKYSFGKSDDELNPTDNVQVKIKVILKDEQTIDIFYSGSTSFDNYF